jgi:hypothetical protein
MEDIVAVIMVFGTGMVGVVAFSPIGRAIAARIRGPAELPTEELDELREQVGQVQQQLAELAERQDFAERVLAQAKERAILGAPKGSA